MEDINGNQIKKGDILQASKTSRKEGFHKILYWSNESKSEADFVGLMLTHSTSQQFPNNVLLEKDFIIEDEFKWEITHFVNRMFYKLQDWGPFKVIGKINDDGINFIIKYIDYSKPIMPYDEYEKEIKSNQT